MPIGHRSTVCQGHAGIGQPPMAQFHHAASFDVAFHCGAGGVLPRVGECLDVDQGRDDAAIGTTKRIY